MSQTVRDANGDLHVFPDGVSPQQIAEALGLSLGPTKAQVIASAAEASGLNPKLLEGLVATESHGNDYAQGVDPKTGHPTSNLGLTQLGPTVRAQYGVTDPSDYTQTIPAAAKYLRSRLDTNGGDVVDALKFYHGGPDQSKWGPYTNAYPTSVLSAAGLQPSEALAAAPGAMSLDEMNAGPKETAARFGPQAATIQTEIAKANEGLTPSTTESTLGNYGFGTELANGTLLGASPYIAGAVNMARGGTFSAGAAGARDVINAYGQEHPILKATADVIGSTPTTMGALGLAGKAMAPGLDAVRALGPEAEAGVNFLTGNAGNFGRGFGQSALALGSAASRGAAEGAATGLIDSQLQPDVPIGQQAALGGLVGGVLNPALTAIGHTVIPYATKVAPGVAESAQDLADQGVDIRGLQLSQDPAARKLDARLFGEDNTNLLGQFTSAARKTIGLDAAPTLKAGDIEDAADAIGRKFESVRLDPNLQIDFNAPNPKSFGFQQELNDLYSKLNTLPLEDSKLGAAKKLYDKITESGIIGGGGINGEEYLSLTKKGGPIDVLMRNSDPDIRRFAGQVRNSLDNALEEGALNSGNPGLVSTIRDARSQWKNLLTLQPLVEKAEPAGTLNPQALAGRVRTMFNDYGWGPEAGGTLGRLSEGGKLLPAPAVTGEAKAVAGQNSKGVINQLLHNPMVAGGVGLGAGMEAIHGLGPVAGFMAAHPIPTGLAAIGTVTGLGGRAAVHGVQKAVLASPEFRNYLIQNALNPAARRVGTNALTVMGVEAANAQRNSQ